MIFFRKVREFYIIIARKIFFPIFFFGGGGHVPPAPVFYAYVVISRCYLVHLLRSYTATLSFNVKSAYFTKVGVADIFKIRFGVVLIFWLVITVPKIIKRSLQLPKL